MLSKLFSKTPDPVVLHVLQTHETLLLSLESVGQYTRPGFFLLNREKDPFYRQEVLFALHRKAPQGLQRLGFLWRGNPDGLLSLEVWCYGSHAPIQIDLSGAQVLPSRVSFSGLKKEKMAVTFPVLPRSLDIAAEGGKDPEGFRFRVVLEKDQG